MARYRAHDPTQRHLTGSHAEVHISGMSVHRRARATRNSWTPLLTRSTTVARLLCPVDAEVILGGRLEIGSEERPDGRTQEPNRACTREQYDAEASAEDPPHDSSSRDVVEQCTTPRERHRPIELLRRMSS